MSLMTPKRIDELRAAAAFDPTKKSYSASIQNLCQQIESEKLTVPIYQRNLSWTHKKAVDLFNFQLHGKSAISAISIIIIENDVDNSGNGIKQLKFLTREPINKKARLETIIDGQQRLSTNYKAYIGHEDFDRIVLDLGTGNFRDIKEEGHPNIKQIPVTKLLHKNPSILSSYLKDTLLSSDEFNDVYMLLLEIRSKLHSYSYTINVAEDLTYEEQRDWFEILNNAGTRVKDLQIGLSKIEEGYSLDIYDYFERFKDILLESSLSIKKFNPMSTENSIPTCALSPWYEVYFNLPHKDNYAPFPSDAKPKVMAKLAEEDLEEIISRTLKSLELALGFLKEHSFGVTDSISRMDYILYLVGYLAYHNDEITNPEYLVEWMNYVDFAKKDNGTRRVIFENLINNMPINELIYIKQDN